MCNLRYRTYQQPDFQQNHWFNGAQQPVNRSYRPRFKRQHLSRRKYFTPTPNRYDSLLPSSSVDHPLCLKPHDKSIEFKNVVAQTTDDSFVPSNSVHSSFVKPNENIEVKNVAVQTSNESSVPSSSLHPPFVKPKDIIKVKDVNVQTTSLTEEFEMTNAKESYEQASQTEVFTATVSIQTMVYIPPFIDMPEPPQIDDNELECLKAKYQSKCSSYGKVDDVTVGPHVAEREVIPLFSKLFRSAVAKYAQFTNSVSQLSE